MKKYNVLLLIVISLFLVTACNSKNKVIVNNEKIDTSKMIHEYCVREGTIDDGEVKLEYDIYYTGENLNLLKSNEQVSSTNSDILDTYENSYNQIHAHYKDIEYYDTEVVRKDDSVTSTMTINYDKVDVRKILSIEGEKDNIFENNKAKVEKWKSLAKKFGTKCEEVEEES